MTFVVSSPSAPRDWYKFNNLSFKIVPCLAASEGIIPLNFLELLVQGHLFIRNRHPVEPCSRIMRRLLWRS